MQISIKTGTMLDTRDDIILLTEHSCFTASVTAPAKGTKASIPSKMNAPQHITVDSYFMHAYSTTIYPTELKSVLVPSDLISLRSSGTAPVERNIIKTHASAATSPIVINDI